ncbi:MAG: hypothetical protein JWL83_1409 [Actinomycetia bacterium]|nr:hypothetical protein [Actinomycetes bacterium]
MRTDADDPARVRDPTLELLLSHTTTLTDEWCTHPKACATSTDRQLWRGVPGDEVGQMLQRVVEVVLLERRELEVLTHVGRDR